MIERPDGQVSLVQKIRVRIQGDKFRLKTYFSPTYSFGSRTGKGNRKGKKEYFQNKTQAIDAK